jgi:NAD(P)-dependent dehydrogenase (short-subunit alcohol dehydrogenase family)
VAAAQAIAVAERPALIPKRGQLAQFYRLAMHPMLGRASLSMVNAGLEGFVRAAALELPRKLRINAVSPPWVKETMVKFGMDPTRGLASAEVATAYVAAVEGSHQGKIVDPRHKGEY